MTHPDPMLHPQEAHIPAPRRSAWRWASYAVAILLLALCVWLALDKVQPAAQRLRQAAAGDILLMLAMVVLNLGLDAWVFWAVLVPFGPKKPVGLARMGALMAATALLNYLPMRAGLIGRAAYLKRQHRVGYRVSVWMMLAVAAITLMVYVLMLGLTLLLRQLNTMWWTGCVAGLVLLASLSVATLCYGQRWLPARLRHWLHEAHAAIDWLKARPARAVIGATLVFALRAVSVGCRIYLLYIAAGIVGTPLDASSALVIAVGGMFVTLAAPLPNGLGLREMVYGWLATLGLTGAALPDSSSGVVLGLIERAIEALIFLAAGLPALFYLHQTAVEKDPA